MSKKDARRPDVYCTPNSSGSGRCTTCTCVSSLDCEHQPTVRINRRSSNVRDSWTGLELFPIWSASVKGPCWGLRAPSISLIRGHKHGQIHAQQMPGEGASIKGIGGLNCNGRTQLGPPWQLGIAPPGQHCPPNSGWLFAIWNGSSSQLATPVVCPLASRLGRTNRGTECVRLKVCTTTNIVLCLAVVA